MAFTPRMTAPTDLSTYYGSYNSYNRFSSYGNEGNCTWYAYGRTGEIAGRNIYNDFYITQTPGNGKDWIYNTWPSYTHTSGTIDIHVGDILVWGGGTYGHVEVVEQINGNNLITSYSISGENWAKSRFFANRTISKPTWGSYLGTVMYNDGSTAYLTNTFIGYIHNKYVDDSPTPPDPGYTIEPEVTVYPSSYDSIMLSNEDYLDFAFNIIVTGIPAGYSASGNNTYPGLSRVANTGWSYTDYTGSDGNTYRRATKSQTLRYEREFNSNYTTTKYMYFSFSYPNGSASSTTPMRIRVDAKPSPAKIMFWKRRKKKFTLDLL